MMQGEPGTTAFTGSPSAISYILGNSSLLITQYDIAGILASTPNGVSFNGSLWTLAFEAACYVMVAALGVAGLLRRRPVVVVWLAGLLAVLTALQEAGAPVFVNDRVLRLVFVFVLGMLAYLYASLIPLRLDLAVTEAAIFVLSVALFDDYRVLGAAPLAYLFLWVGVSLPWAWSMRHDLSYGVYIYHWPVMQLLVLTALRGVPTWTFVVVGLLAAILPAGLSWFLVERPALRRKRSAIPDRVAGRLAAVTGRGSERRDGSTA
jgi:peptidoglycan/LPS O-acetylase OafA/YrhL